MQYLKYFLTSLLVILAVSCSLNDLSLPVWNTNLKVHLNTDQISMSEVLKEESLKDSLNANLGDTLIYVSINDTTEPKYIEQSDLAFKADDDQFIEEIGDIELDDPEPRTTKPKTLPQMIPALPIQVGQNVIIPDTTVPVSGLDVEFDSYETVTIKKGRMFLEFHNDLTIDIDSGMVVTVFNEGNEIGQFIFDQMIPQNSMVQSTDLDLANEHLTNMFVLEYLVPIIGSDGQVRTITEQDTAGNITTIVHIADMDVTEAYAEIPEQTTTKRDASAIDSEDKDVIAAKISSGNVFLDITNTTAVSADILIHILSVVDDNDLPLTRNGIVYADSLTHFEIDLSDYNIVNSENPGVPLDSINYEVIITSIPTGAGNFVNIRSDEQIIVDVVMDSIYVDTFEGAINNMTIDIDRIEEDNLVDLSDLQGTFRLPDLNLIFTFYNEINFDINLDLVITGEKVENGVVTKSVTLNVPASLNRGQTGNPVQTVVIVDGQSGSPNIVDLMAIFPTRITVDGTGTINGTGSVNLGDKLWARYTIESPLKIQIDQKLVIDMDLDSLTSDNLDNDARKAIADDLNDVSITLDIENGLPFGTDLLFVMALDSTNMFTQPDDSNRIIIETTVDGGQVDANSGLVQTPAKSMTTLEISKEELQIFKRKNNFGKYMPVYYRAQVTIDSSDAPIQFRKSDELRYNGLIDVKYKVDIE
jgi:hypothetical protein